MRAEFCYILNTVTDQNFDTIENKFYNAYWEPVLELRQYLEYLISENPKKFKDCVIIDTSL